MTRIISHHILFQGKDYGLAIAEIDDRAHTLKIYPFTGEMHSTMWVDGPVVIKKSVRGTLSWQKTEITR